MSKQIIKTFILILVSVAALCQPQDLYFHHLNVEEGLSKTFNFFFLKDSKGLVWISSGGGLNCYNGQNIKQYFPEASDPGNSMYGSSIQSPFYEDSDQNIWFTTSVGLNCYIRKTDSFVHYTCPNPKGGDYNNYYAMASDAKQNLWIIVRDKLYLFNIQDKKWYYQYDLMEGSLRLFPQFDEGGNPKRVFVTSHHHPGMLDISYGQEAQIPKIDTIFDQQDTRTQLTVYDVYIEQENRVWLAADRGLQLYDPISGQIIGDYDKFEGKTITYVTKIEPYQDSLLFIATASEGLLMFNKYQNEFVKNYRHHPTDPHSLAGDHLNNVKVIDGGIWVSVNAIGIDFAYPTKNKFQGALSYPSDPNLLETFKVSAIAEDKEGNIWVGSNRSGIAVFSASNQQWRYFKALDYPLLQAKVNQILVDKDNNIWIFTWYNVLRFNASKQQFDTVLDGVPPGINQRFLSVLEMKDGRILLPSTVGGVYELVVKGDRVVLAQFEQIPSNQSYINFFETTEGILIGKNFGQSLHLYDLNNGYAKQEISVDFIYMNGVHETLNELWMATDNGLVVLDKKSWKIKANYTEQEGLSTRTLSGILGDDAGKLWLSSANGMMQFDPTTKKVQNYDLEDGLVAKEYSMWVALQDSKGRFWFGSTNGVNRFFPNQVNSLKVLPTPGITKIVIDDDPKTMEVVCDETGATNPMEIKKIILPYKHNTITFYFSALEYSAPSQNEYQYRMDGFDEKDKWVQAGNDGFARYANLPPGAYTFQVKASNSDGVWNNDNIRKVKIKVPTPWHMTWWAKIGYILAGISIVGIYFYQQIKQYKEVEKVRKRIAADIHDDLGSGLTSISILAQLSNATEEKDSEMLDSIDKTAKRVSDNMRSLIWANNPEKDGMENVLLKMREEGYERFAQLNIDFVFEEANGWGNYRLPGDKRNHIMSIYREAITNIIKYAEASKVTVTVDRQHKKGILTIKDNGTGFYPSTIDPTANGGGNGLQNMKDRAKKIGEFHLDSSPEKGTTIVVTFPVRNETKKRFFSKAASTLT